MVKREDLVRNRHYKITKQIEGNRLGTEVIFHGMTANGNYAICNPVDEPSMQDSFCANPEVDLEEVTNDPEYYGATAAGHIGVTLTHIMENETKKLLGTLEKDLESYWWFKYDRTSSIDWNIYQFSECLESYKRNMRKWEEHHNGTSCVVERVRDKYLMPKIKEFRALTSSEPQ